MQLSLVMVPIWIYNMETMQVCIQSLIESIFSCNVILIAWYFHVQDSQVSSIL
jgi:hypothetical protein